MNQLVRSILATIKYAEKYRGGLTVDQLYHRLLSNKRYGRQEIVREIKKGQIKIRQGDTNQISRQKLAIAGEFTKTHLTKFANIRLVAVTGSVAAKNARKNEDIDLLVVCRADTLWLTRLRLWLYLKWWHIPHRRYGQKEGRDELCLNLWLEENQLILPPPKQNQKNAVDLILMVPILDRGGIYQEMIRKNSWAKNYVANGYSQLSVNSYQLTVSQTKKNMFVRAINEIAYWGQKVFMRLKGPISFIDKHRAFFHKN